MLVGSPQNDLDTFRGHLPVGVPYYDLDSCRGHLLVGSLIMISILLGDICLLGLTFSAC